MTRLDAAVLARHHRRNRMQTLLVLAGIGGWMALVGWLIGGWQGVAWSLAGTVVGLVVQPVRSAVALRALFGAQPLSADDAPGLARLVAGLAERAGLAQAPPLLLVPRPELLALSTGTGHDCAIALSAGLVSELVPRELAAVLAHEISHLRHGDLRILRLAEAAGRLTRFLALFGLLSLLLLLPMAMVSGTAVLPLSLLPLLVVAPVASDLLTLKLSRTREFEADAGAVELTGDPEGMMIALKHIDRVQGGGWERLLRGPAWLALIRTHPTTAERLVRLEEMAVPAEPAVWTMPAEALLLPGLYQLGPWERRRRMRGPWG